jgi:DNA-binding CsgD family transcriptional regulator
VNDAVFVAALRAGCPKREAEVLAMYVEHDSAEDVARELGVATTTVTGHLGRAKRRLNVRHTAGVIAKLVA